CYGYRGAVIFCFFFSSRRRHTRSYGDWSSDVCSSDLKKEDFKLFEDGIERPIASFNVEKIEGAPRPVAIVFALDLSGSMTPEEIARISDAMREFSKRLAEHPAVFAVVTFGMRVKTIQSFTGDREKLERAFERL